MGYQVNESVLRTVLKYCTDHLDDGPTVADDDADSRKKNTDISPADQATVNGLDQEALFEVILVSVFDRHVPFYFRLTIATGRQLLGHQRTS